MAADGSGRQAITNELDKLGITPPNPEREYWSPSMVTSIIKNEVYKGDIVWGKFSYKKRHGHYEKKRVPKEEWIIKEKAHDPIVSDELWEKANQAHSGRHRAPSTNLDKKLSNPLAGVLRCHCCGYSMLNIPRQGRRSSMMRCPNPACKGVQKSSYFDIVEQKLLIMLEDYISELEKSSPMEEKESIIPVNNKVIQTKRKELDTLHGQKNKLHDLLERGVYDIDTFLERQGMLIEQINDAEKVIETLEKENELEELKNKQSGEYIPTVRKVIEAYQHTDDVEKKNRLLKSVLEKATYLRKKEWKAQGEFEIHLFPRI